MKINQRILVSGKEIKGMAKVCRFGQMEPSTKVNGKIILRTEKALFGMPITTTNMKVK